MRRALTHRSYLSEHGKDRRDSNEQMEFLGDAVLDLIVADYVYRRFPEKTEGDLSRLKSSVVNGKSLKNISKRIKLGEYVFLSQNEAHNGGRDRSSILEDTLEAVVAAIYLDGGMEAATRFVGRNVLPDLDNIIQQNIDSNYKSQLLEYAQSRHLPLPTYRIVHEAGPDHSKHFEIEVSLSNQIFGLGRGRSKKAAQQDAARDALRMLKRKGYFHENI